MKKIVITLALIFSIFSFVQTSSASVLEGSSLDQLKGNTWSVKEAGGLGSVSVGYIVASVIKAGLSLLGVIFLILMVIAGFQWMTAAGNETKVEKATSMIKAALIGLIIVLAAYSITYFIFTYLPFSGSGGTGGTGETVVEINHS